MTTTPLTDLDVELLLSGTAVPESALDRDLMDLLGAMRVPADEPVPAPSTELGRVLAGLSPVAVATAADTAPSTRGPVRRLVAWFAGLGVGTQVALTAASAAAAVGMSGAVGVLPAGAQKVFDDTVHRLGLPAHHADSGDTPGTSGSGGNDTSGPGATGDQGRDHAKHGASDHGNQAGAHVHGEGEGADGAPDEAVGHTQGAPATQVEEPVTPSPAEGPSAVPGEDHAGEDEPGEDASGDDPGDKPEKTPPGQTEGDTGSANSNGHANGHASGAGAGQGQGGQAGGDTAVGDTDAGTDTGKGTGTDKGGNGGDKGAGDKPADKPGDKGGRGTGPGADVAEDA